MLEELDDLFESSTIRPTFSYVHIILALYIFEKHPEGIGRYRLKENLLIGSGTARSLINKLSKVVDFIEVSGNNKRRGHVLTDKGLRFLKMLKKKIPLLEEGNTKALEEIIIQDKKLNAYICLIKNCADKLNSGIEQRDAAIKVNGSGATCLIFDGNDLKYPKSPNIQNNQVKIGDNLQKYFKLKTTEHNTELEMNDVIIVGLGDTSERARLATLNSALTLIE